VSPRSILFIGGTGVINAAAAERAVALGHRLTILNRGRQTTRGQETKMDQISDAARTVLDHHAGNILRAFKG
jgi:NAD(P)-dependent dehydrogenase (short-subunit alcohol dehydrogenase family)